MPFLKRILRRTFPRTPGVEYIYPDLLFIFDMFSSFSVFATSSELKHSAIMIRQDCQNLLLKILTVLLN